MTPAFQSAVQEILDRYVSSGDELGVQCVIWKDGAVQAECYGGYCDEAKTRPVTADALFPIFSAGKALFSTLALMLVEENVVGLDMPLAEVWPAFGAPERRGVNLRHVLTHTSGMHIMPQPANPEELSNWDLMCSRIAERKPLWTPGTRTRYQAMNYTWLLGETLSRATGKPLPMLFQEKLLKPLGIENDTFFGIPADQEFRLGQLVNGPDLAPFLPPRQTFLDPLTNALRLRCIRAACMPAFNCLSNARGLAKFGAALLQGRLISKNMLYEATRLQRPKGEVIPSDNLNEYWTIFGYGYLLLGKEADRGAFFGHQGHGGSEIMLDQQTGTVYAFVKNRLSARVLQPMKEEIRRIFAR